MGKLVDISKELEKRKNKSSVNLSQAIESLAARAADTIGTDPMAFCDSEGRPQALSDLPLSLRKIAQIVYNPETERFEGRPPALGEKREAAKTLIDIAKAAAQSEFLKRILEKDAPAQAPQAPLIEIRFTKPRAEDEAETEQG